MAQRMTDDQANAVFDILAQHAGASPGGGRRDDFIAHQTAGSTDDYRFQGALGFGGKFWNCNGLWYVTAYPEDLEARPDRRAAVDTTNAKLAALRSSAVRFDHER